MLVGGTAEVQVRDAFSLTIYQLQTEIMATPLDLRTYSVPRFSVLVIFPLVYYLVRAVLSWLNCQSSSTH